MSPSKAILESMIRDVDLGSMSVDGFRILEELSPLLKVDSSLDAVYSGALKTHLTTYARAVENTHIALINGASACRNMASSIHIWHRLPGSVECLPDICGKLLLVHEGALEAEKEYAEARTGFNALFDSFVDSQGPDSFISVETKGKRWSVLSKISAANLALKVFPHLENTERQNEMLGRYCLQLHQWLQPILQDENAILTPSVEETDLWFEGARDMWNRAADEMVLGIAHLVGLASCHPEVFTTREEFVAKLYESSAGLTFRNPAVAPDVDIADKGIVGAKSSSNRQGPIPRELSFEYTFSHTASITLVGIDKMKEGNSKITLMFKFIPWDDKGPFHSFAISCEAVPVVVSDVSATVKVLDYFPQCAADFSTDTDGVFLPLKRKPRLAIATPSPSAVKWVFSQVSRKERTMADSQLHDQLQVTLTLEHSVDFKLNIDLDIMRLKWRVWKQVEPRQHASFVVYA